MDLSDKAEGGGAPDVVLAADQPHRPEAEILDDELTQADDITGEGQFPEFGSFLHVRAGGTDEWWECPQSLAEEVIEKAEEIEAEAIPGLQIDVREVVKTSSGEWRYDVRVWDPSAEESA